MLALLRRWQNERQLEHHGRSFSASMGTVEGDGKIRRSHRRDSAPSKGFGREREGGGRKVSMVMVVIGSLSWPKKN